MTGTKRFIAGYGRAGVPAGGTIEHVTFPEPGAQIHASHPFADPAGVRRPVRRFRGRMPTPVTLWTAHDDPGRTGLTVASTQVVDGDPGRVFGHLDADSDLYEAIRESGAFAVHLLAPRHQDLADRFGGLAPAPGGLFRGGERWRDTRFGPVLEDVGSWIGCRLAGTRDAGWGQWVEGVIEEVTVGDDEPLLHHRGRYRRLA
ncbi:MAG TPA: flavin reductase family protein [Micromonosporaceae bacterium]|nr:flavin reductase family protein [Micromonosporaceae bacterium]